MTIVAISSAKHPKMRVGVLATALTFLVAASCDGGSTIKAVPDWGGGALSPYVPDGYELTFEDNFDRLDLVDRLEASPPTNGDKAAKSWGTSFTGWGVRHLEGNNDQALKADVNFQGFGGKSLGEHGIQLHEVTADGTLKLYGRQTPDDLQSQFGLPFLGGMMSAQGVHAQRYGYWEVRLRPNNVSNGHHWALWLIPDDNAWPPEIDMLEIVGSNPENQSDADHFFFNSILSDPNTDNYTRIIPPRGRDAWYTIGFLWDENDMRWFLDGEEVRRRPSLELDKALYFLISPEIGGKWVGAPTGGTKWPMEIELDYVRIYSKSSSGG